MSGPPTWRRPLGPSEIGRSITVSEIDPSQLQPGQTSMSRSIDYRDRAALRRERPRLSIIVRSRPEVLALTALVLFAVILRVARMGDRSYWYDEGFSWKVITYPWAEMVARIAEDTAPPLYYILLKAWSLAFGDSWASLRMLSVILGGLTIVGTYLFAVEAFREDRPSVAGASRMGRGVRTGLLVALLIALSAFQARWSGEARMYTLGTSLAAFSSWLLLRALRAPVQGLGAWVWYAVVALAFAYTQYYALFSIAAQGLFVAGHVAIACRWSPLAIARDVRSKFAAVVAAILVIGYLPWLPGFLNQVGQVREDFWVGPLEGETVMRTFYQMFARSEHEIPSAGVAMATAEVCFLASLALLWRAGPGEWFVFLSVWVPFALSVAVSVLVKPIFVTHYFLFAHLFFLVAIASLIERIPMRIVRRLVASGVVLGFAWAYLGYASDGSAFKEKPGARGAAVFLDERRAPGETSVVCSPMLTPSVEGHARNRDGWRTFKSNDYVHYQGMAAVRDGEYITSDEMKSLNSPRLWVVDISRWEKGSVNARVPGEWVRAGEWRFPEIYGDGCEIIVREYLPGPRRPDGRDARPGGVDRDRRNFPRKGHDLAARAAGLIRGGRP